MDESFVEAVRSALTAHVDAIRTEAAGDQWSGLSHRALAKRIKTLVAAWCWPDGADPELLNHAARLALQLRDLQGGSGLFVGGDNFDSPPDTAFSINDLADARLLLRAASADKEELARLLDDVLAAAKPALLTGGVHTPNHRWELSAALVRLHRLVPEAGLLQRASEWLAEGIDIDDDGLYSERSPLYGAHVSSPSLLVLADVLDRPDLLAAVERHLAATVDLLLPDGSVESVQSRRQDQRIRRVLAGYLLPLRRLALLRGRGDFAWAAGLSLGQGVDEPADAATDVLLRPEIAGRLPAPVPPPRSRTRHFRAAGLLLDHRPAATAVVFGGADRDPHGRVRSGLANSPTFLRLVGGTVALDSVRLSRTFFGLGPFRADALVVDDSAGSTTATLTETVTAAYYQPLAPADRDPAGRYALTDEGRFSASMSFGRRDRDELSLRTVVQLTMRPTGVELTLDLTGAAVDWTLELAFRPGGVLSGARPLGDHRWQLDLAAEEPARYRVGDAAIAVAVLAWTGERPADREPRYQPGEEYEYLGGTDAAGGELLYLAGRAPARLRIGIATPP